LPRDFCRLLGLGCPKQAFAKIVARLEFSKLNIPVVDVGTVGTVEDMGAKFLRFRQLLAADNIDSVVWISVSTLMAFAFGLGIAPRQAWWSFKFFGMEVDGIDAYIAGTLKKSLPYIEDRWQDGFVSLSKPASQPSQEQINTIKDQFPKGKTILASIAREEPINRKGFLSAVTDILKSNPDTIYLWT